ncbi:hypothetical protein F4780DRAFT_319670 [Xylariomycetidae sp. FL0641]|nr:hypothetical protein F4780DRAFT_319670 [Xylariomycetidae sp. FL0641]
MAPHNEQPEFTLDASYQNLLDRAATHKGDLKSLFDSVFSTSSPSYTPIEGLSALLSTTPTRWSPLDVQVTYSKSWKMLPEEAKIKTAQDDQLVDRVLRQCKNTYTSLLDLLHPESKEPSIIDPDTGRQLPHNKLAESIRNFRLPIPAGTGRPGQKPVVAISLPNGALLALTVLATATYYTAAPVAHGTGVGAQQFRADVLQSKSDVVLATPKDVSRLGLRDAWLSEAGITVYLVEFGDDMSLQVRDLDGKPADNKHAMAVTPSTADDTAILLFTSGTSGTKKLVPLTVHSLVSGVAMVVDSWHLKPSSRCLNQMPLHHVGGIVRNMFAPVMSGGSVICCGAFDANLFWDCVEDYAPTWYYASPSMHQCILEAGGDRPESMAKSQIRLICNAAGGLLPSLACQLRDAFSVHGDECVVLPSYGMTECMPISTPPMSYRLEKTGTSGISVGPEIAILDDRGVHVSPGTLGRINVRGLPAFGGYLKADDTMDTSCFNPSGFFDTGDLGYMDEEGYLFITGRSKEVINRGGELISPFEIEEAIMTATKDPNSELHNRVDKALAFSVKHDVLQEVVGVVVSKPEDGKRTSLQQIQAALKPLLSQVKLPTLVVFMDGGVPTNNNKVLRIRLADRLGLPEVSDNSPAADRHYEAVCPPVNTPLSEPIQCKPVAVDYTHLRHACEAMFSNDFDVAVVPDASDFYPRVLLAPRGDEKSSSNPDMPTEILSSLKERLNGYHHPSRVHCLEEPLPRDANGKIAEHALAALLVEDSKQGGPIGDLTPTEASIASMFSQVLGVPAADLSAASDFFELGGDSMRAGRLLTLLRKNFQIRLPIDALFVNSSISALGKLTDQKLGAVKAEQAEESGSSALEKLAPGCEKTYSSTHPLTLILHLLPLFVLWPMRRALTWTVFMYFLAFTQGWITHVTIPGRLLNLVLSMAVGRAVTKTVTPLLAIIFKWLVIGRYKEGVYPMWGPYHSRWWITQKVIATAGSGIFGYFDCTRNMFYRLMGAKIGKNVVIPKGATLGEYDLITIEDNVVLDRCLVRPFGAERNTSMYLGRIHIGENSSVGLASIVAPGTTVPPNTCIGPNSSSWELDSADESNRDLLSNKIPGAHWLLTIFAGGPIQVITTFIGAVPWLGCLIALVRHKPGAGGDAVKSVILWFSSPSRVGYHYAALAANSALGPLFFFAGVVIIKKFMDLCFGKITPGPAQGRSQQAKFRMQLIRDILPAGRLRKLTELFGTHYEATSVFMRLMGAKVGQRVYWPGTGPSLQDYDLIDVGDDVVFGSRSHIVTSDGSGSDVVRIRKGAMVADRVVLLPGVELGDSTVMGSGALTKRDHAYPADTTWVGSKAGEAVSLSGEKSVLRGCKTPESEKTIYASNASSSRTLGVFLQRDTQDLSSAEKGQSAKAADGPSATVESTEKSSLKEGSSIGSSPFGRAFYQKQAPYRVLNQFEIFLYSIGITILTAVYWNVGSVSAVQGAGRLFRDQHWLTLTGFLGYHVYRPISLFLFFLGLIIGIMAVQTILVLLFVIAAKWVLLGRRQPGEYDWDQSSYCQRWQLFLKLESLRRNCYGGNGILGMLSGSYWIVLYFRAMGATIGKDCALFCNGEPSLLFTEPDLLTLGDRVAVDDASLVGHINTRGKFALNPLSVGDRSVLRSGSRLLSGGSCQEDTCLLEHTLVMAGDVVDAGTTVQGWPAEEFTASRMPTLKAKQIWTLA